MDQKLRNKLVLIKDIVVIVIFAVSIWMLVTSIKNEREAYRILNQSNKYLEEGKRIDSLLIFRQGLKDSVYVLPSDTIGEVD